LELPLAGGDWSCAFFFFFFFFAMQDVMLQLR
jgi:hypothetical protein